MPRVLRVLCGALALAGLATSCGRGGIPASAPDGGSDAPADAGVCAGRSSCSTPGSSCDGGDLVTCSADADGCLLATRVACAAGLACRAEADAARCIDPCAGISDCSVPGRACAGNTLVTCAANEQGCLVSATRSCGATQQLCDAAAPEGADCVDACAGLVTCEEAGASCAAGVLSQCLPDARGCLRPTTVDCAELHASCVDAGGGVASCVAAGVCAGRPLCARAGTSCRGDVLVACADDADGCRVATERDCAAEGALCREGADGARCVDRCEGLVACAAEGRACDTANGRQDLVTCAAVDGCIVETARRDCAATAGHICDPAPRACVDRCAGVSDCSTPGRTCGPDDTLVDCRADANGCLVRSVVSCADEGKTCRSAAGSASCSDVCAGRPTCAQASRSCSGSVLESCAPDADGCLVRASDDCAARGLTCDAAAGACTTASCAAAIAVDCRSGRVTAGTANGTAQLASYSACAAAGVTYGANEKIFFFSNPQPVEVTATSTLLGTSAGNVSNYYLFLLEGTPPAACADATACLARSDYSNMGKTQTSLRFATTPGQGRYLVLDGTRWSGAPTADFALDLACTPIVCGDGTRGSTEACDDGDTEPGDGCSPDCRVESGWLCSGSDRSTCRRIVCGDGFIDAGEECDDAVAAGGDGCSAACRIETGWRCSGAPSRCVSGATSCTNALRLTAGTYSFDTTPFQSTYNHYANLCGVGWGGGASGDMTFVTSVPARTLLSVKAVGSGWSPRVAVSTSCSADVASIQGSCQTFRPGAAQWLNEADAPVDAWIVVDGAFDGTPGDRGPFGLELAFAAPAALQPGQACQNAVRLAAGVTVTGDTTGGLDVYDGYRSSACIGFAHGPDATWVVNVPAGRTLVATVTAAAAYDTAVVISDSCPGLVAGCRAYSNVVKPVKATVVNNTGAAKDYFIVVDGFSERDFGAYSLATTVN